MKTNWEARIKNPVFWVQIFLAIMAPILTYAGLTYADITSWSALGDLLFDAIMNPYVLGMVAISVWNAISDPTATPKALTKKSK